MTVWAERLLLGAFGVFVGVEAWRLDQQNRDLRKSIETAAIQRIGETAIQPGTSMTGVRGNTSDEAMASVNLTDGQVLLITFSAGCPVTRASIQSWLEAAHVALGRGDRVVWLSRDRLSAASRFAREHQLPGVMLADVPYDVYARFGLSVVPQTLVVKGGIVRASWQGAIGSNTIVAALKSGARGQGG